MVALFGTAGNPEAFYASGHKASVEMPSWLAELGLTAYEYQCGRGVNIRQATAASIGSKAQEFGIRMSIHAPYFINLASEEENIIANTQKHFLKALEAAQWMGADRIVFHIGSPGKKERSEAMGRAQKAFAAVLEKAEQNGLTGVYLLPETMGKQNQLGTLAEVLSLCSMSEWVIPAVDFGHLHAVTQGRYTEFIEYENVFDTVGEALGGEIAQNLHIHFSKIEFTKAGERRHWTFDDPYGPPHEYLLELIAKRGYSPRIICESAGTQAKDAKLMQDIYFSMISR